MVPDPHSLFRRLRDGAGPGLPPVHTWNPTCEQDIGMRIARDGTWFYQDSPISRQPMVKLFSSVLRCDDDGYWLVTPAEKVRVEVDVAPFLAIRMEVTVEDAGPALAFQTNVDDIVVVDDEHPLWVEEDIRGPVPLVRVRDRLDALLTRSVFYELGDSAQARQVDGREVLGVTSRGRFWVLGTAA